MALGARIAALAALAMVALGAPTLQQKLSTRDNNDNSFGDPVSFSPDGTLLFAGAVSTVVEGTARCGAAYLFARNASGGFAAAQSLTAQAQMGLNFGRGTFSPDGATLALRTPNANSSCGAVFIYTSSAGKWALSQALSASDPAEATWFGSETIFSADSTKLFVSSVTALDIAVFTRDASGVWSRSIDIKGTSPNGGLSGRHYARPQ